MTTLLGAAAALGYFAAICLMVGLCRAARRKPKTTTTTTVTETYLPISPAMFARLRGIHGPEDQAAAVRELHELAQYESEFKS